MPRAVVLTGNGGDWSCSTTISVVDVQEGTGKAAKHVRQMLFGLRSRLIQSEVVLQRTSLSCTSTSSTGDLDAVSAARGGSSGTTTGAGKGRKGGGRGRGKAGVKPPAERITLRESPEGVEPSYRVDHTQLCFDYHKAIIAATACIPGTCPPLLSWKMLSWSMAVRTCVFAELMVVLDCPTVSRPLRPEPSSFPPYFAPPPQREPHATMHCWQRPLQHIETAGADLCMSAPFSGSLADD